jgi:hypothetical protein
MPKGGLEPPRAKTLTWPSTMRVYQIPPLRQNGGECETVPSKNKIYGAVNSFSVLEVSSLFPEVFFLYQPFSFLFRLLFSPHRAV